MSMRVDTYQQTAEATVWRWYIAALAFFGLASMFGLLMRYGFVGSLHGLVYKHLLHAHSHVALMGWAFTALSTMLMYLFAWTDRSAGVVNRLMMVNAVSVIGMAASFTWQGYGPLSIAFSSLHLLCAYYFGGYFLRQRPTGGGAARFFARWAVIWLLVSTVGIWATGLSAAILGKQHALYFMSVQFFLHFQFNGWIAYAVLALLFQWAEKLGAIDISYRLKALLAASVLLTYAQSVSWSTPASALFYLNTTGVLLQLAAYFLLLQKLLPALRQQLAEQATGSRWLLQAGMASLAAKVLIQVAVALPFVAVISYTIRMYVIGFIHLILLGAFTMTLGGSVQLNGLQPRTGRQWGWRLLLAGFILTEALLFLQGSLLWAGAGYLPHYHLLLFAFSLFFPLGIGSMLLDARATSKQFYTHTQNR